MRAYPAPHHFSQTCHNKQEHSAWDAVETLLEIVTIDFGLSFIASLLP
jgi:hypothetical protein